jgi:hypothetical protein
MDKELRAIEFEALANEAQVICIEVQPPCELLRIS